MRCGARALGPDPRGTCLEWVILSMMSILLEDEKSRSC